MASSATQPRPTFHVEASLQATRGHHASIQALWGQKWQKPASMGIYPFVDGLEADFAPAFSALADRGLTEPYDPDEYAAAFFPAAQALEAQASTARGSGDDASARDLDLRAAAVYRIARFPINRSPRTQEAWERGKAAYLRASPHLSPPNAEVEIAHAHGLREEQASGPIRAYLRLPAGASAASPAPVLLFICGLDAYRTDHTNRTQAHVDRGFACLSVDIPGTGDSPALRGDPAAPDRLWSSVLDWVAAQPQLDAGRLCARGVSTGGYYAMRLAHTHAHRLAAVVAQGGGAHFMFHPDWIAAQDRMEYPFALAGALAFKFGYGDDMERWAREALPKFSLLEGGILERESCRLLLINGTEDEIFPIEDSMLLLNHGSVKDARFIEHRFHMGNPEAEPMVYDWLDQFK